MNNSEIAKVAHEINMAYCISIGDTSQVPWEDAPEWQRESAINGVEFHLNNKDSSPEDSHVNWLKEKIDNGWVYSEVKDIDKKTHPCCVPYAELSTQHKTKDYLFKQVVDSLS